MRIIMDKKQFLKRGLLWLVFTVYLLTVLKMTVIRDGFFPEHFFTGSLNLLPFAEYLRLWRAGDRFSFLYYLVGNIAWFVPFGLLAGLIYGGRVRRPFLRIIFMALAFSAFIEVLQYVMGTGVTELDDVILNTLGAALGCLACFLLKKFVRYLRRLYREHREEQLK